MNATLLPMLVNVEDIVDDDDVPTTTLPLPQTASASPSLAVVGSKTSPFLRQQQTGVAPSSSGFSEVLASPRSPISSNSGSISFLTPPALLSLPPTPTSLATTSGGGGGGLPELPALHRIISRSTSPPNNKSPEPSPSPPRFMPSEHCCCSCSNRGNLPPVHSPPCHAVSPPPPLLMASSTRPSRSLSSPVTPKQQSQQQPIITIPKIVSKLSLHPPLSPSCQTLVIRVLTNWGSPHLTGLSNIQLLTACNATLLQQQPPSNGLRPIAIMNPSNCVCCTPTPLKGDYALARLFSPTICLNKFTCRPASHASTTAATEQQHPTSSLDFLFELRIQVPRESPVLAVQFTNYQDTSEAAECGIGARSTVIFLNNEIVWAGEIVRPPPHPDRPGVTLAKLRSQTERSRTALRTTSGMMTHSVRPTLIHPLNNSLLFRKDNAFTTPPLQLSINPPPPPPLI